jgi:acetyl-CoA carboxylase carboxyl transferase subunit beta
MVAAGTIAGQPLIAAVMEFAFLGASLGVAAGEAVTTAAETALAEVVPLLLATASGGARMQEGVLSLMQMAKTAAAMAALDDAGLLTVTIVTDPTYGGVAASFATLSDVVACEPGARMGFAGPRVISQTTHERLPEGFQTAEFLLQTAWSMRCALVPNSGRCSPCSSASPAGRAGQKVLQRCGTLLSSATLNNYPFVPHNR